MRFLICGVLSAALTSFSFSAQTAYGQVVIGSQGLTPAAQLTIDNSGSNPNALAEIIQLIGTPTGTVDDQVLLLDSNGYVGSMNSNTFQSRDGQGRMVHPTNQPLFFGSQTESTDSLMIKRIQNEKDQSELFFGIGDNPALGNSGEDRIVFGTTNGAFGTGKGSTAFEFTSGGALTMTAYGEGRSYLAGSSSADYVLTASSTGFVRELPASSFSYSTSDERLKSDVQPLDVSLDALLQLEGVQYQWLDENMGSSRQIGFIAQDVEEVFPEVIRTDQDGMKSVGYGFLTAAIVEALRDYSAKTDARLSALEAENEALKAELEALGSASN